MASMTLKTIVFKNKEKFFLTLFNFLFLFFFIYLLPRFVKYSSHMSIFLLWEGARVQNIMFNAFVMNLLSSTRVFRKKES